MVTGIVFFLGDDKIRARSLLIRQHETTGKNAGVRSGEKVGSIPRDPWRRQELFLCRHEPVRDFRRSTPLVALLSRGSLIPPGSTDLVPFGTLLPQRKREQH